MKFEIENSKLEIEKLEIFAADLCSQCFEETQSVTGHKAAPTTFGRRKRNLRPEIPAVQKYIKPLSEFSNWEDHFFIS